jgi:hypothetical protein
MCHAVERSPQLWSHGSAYKRSLTRWQILISLLLSKILFLNASISLIRCHSDYYRPFDPQR